jgi:hypothetical protein
MKAQKLSKVATLRRSQRINSKKTTTTTPSPSPSPTSNSPKPKKPTRSPADDLAELKRARQILENQLGGIIRRRAEENLNHERIIKCYRDQQTILHGRINTYTRQCVAYRDLSNEMHHSIVILKAKIREELGDEFLLEHPERLWMGNEE